MNGYRITINSTEENSEFAPDKKLRDGMDVDGFVLLAFRDDKPNALCLMGCNIMEIATLIASDKSEAGTAVRQAIAIAEGLQKADKIRKEEGQRRAAESIADLLRAK